MDTKLKNNKKSLNWIIYLIVVSIFTSLISILIYDRSVRYSKANYLMELEVKKSMVCDIIPNLAMYTEDVSGKLREESIDAEVNYVKSQVELYKSGVETAQVSAEDLLRSDEEIRQSVIYRFKQEVKDYLANLNHISNVKFYYEAKDNGKVYTNTNATSREEFEEEIVKDNITNNNNEEIYMKNNVYAGIAKTLTPGDSVYSVYEEYQKALNTGKVCVTLLVISAISMLFAIIRLLVNRTKQTLERKETFFSKLYWSFYVEVKVVITLIITFTACVYLEYFRHRYRFDIELIGILFVAFAIYIIVLDLIKLASSKEAGKIIKDKSFIIKLLRYFKVNFIGHLKETKLVRSTLGKSIIVMCIFSVLIILAGILICKAFYMEYVIVVLLGIIEIFILLFGNIYILKIGSALNKIVLASKKISEGNYDEKLEIKSPIILNEIADNIENIQSGLKNAVNKAVKSEKMKGELITNVSHDLKTPLTSIINYVDLLEQKNITEEEKEKYIKVLKEKSNRLKVLIEDLFEVSKASSGNMELNMDNIDVVSLLTQTLVELDDKIETSGLKFIKSFPKEKVVIYADGRKLFRVFQNLLSNIFKYSMKNSRVYIEVKDNINYVEVTFKNISEYELNFTEEEILQRFKRGDESRTTEGSGLGLSIAKSLVELQKGKFEIHIDGDLFKVTIKLVKDK